MSDLLRSSPVGAALVLVALAASGCVDQFSINIARTTLGFDDVIVGDADDEGVDIVLTAGGPAEIEVWIEPPDAPFAVLQHPDPVLAAGDPTFVSVRFQPDRAGDHFAVLVVRFSNIEADMRRDIGLEGTGLVEDGRLVDLDRDGYSAEDDCDDHDPYTHPGALEECDELDNDCDGLLPADESDFDGDGVPSCAGDCSDGDPTTFPGAPELCDGVDNDCDGNLGEDDADADGFRGCDGDCDDGDPFQFPGAPEVCNAADDDCDDILPEDEIDADGDGWHPCSGDCADDDPDRFPGQVESCNEIDDDCDGVVPSDEADLDADGFLGCEECDDADGSVFPGGEETCDGIDTDCDGTVPADEVDDDGDGFLACAECDDSLDSVYPGAPELCDGADTDCEGTVPDDEVDIDGDGVLACADCDDDEDTVFPGAPELCDELDNDCDGTVPSDEVDEDGDAVLICAGDCDDDDDDVFPGAEEECFDDVDSDCDGTINEDCACPIWGWTVALSGCPTFGTYECPWPQAQLAVDAASTSAVCEEAWLRSDTYTENLVVSGDVTIRGPGEADQVILDAGAAGSAITVLDGLDVSVAHLTITGGLADEGGGIHAYDTELYVEDVRFVGNSCEPGGVGAAMFLEDTEFFVSDSLFASNDCGFGLQDDGNDGTVWVGDSGGGFQDNTFEDNTAGDASAIFVADGADFVTIANCSFLDGETGDSDNPIAEIEGGAVVINSDNKLVLNNVFAGNEASSGGGAITVAAQGTNTVIANNVIVYNDSSQGAGIHFEPFTNLGGSASVNNNIFAFNQGFGVWSDVSFFPSDFHYNDIFGNTSGAYGAPIGPLIIPSDNIASDPAFEELTNDGSWSNDDLALQIGSPCIDTGDPNPGYDDLDGTRNDMGIFGGPLGDWSWPAE